MLLAEHSLREGNLDDSLARLQDQVRKEPADAKHRIFLFQLLAVLGQWDRALTQLNVAGELDAGALGMVQTYREALRCEVLRAEVFAGQRSPIVFGEPDEWLALLIEALRLTAQGHFEQAQAVREQALGAAPVTPGELDGQPFEWIADADMRLGPVLEAIINGRYYWVPFQNIRAVQIEEPADLRDLVWTPAYFTWTNGGQSVGLIPTRYPGSETAADPDIRRAHKTEWLGRPGELFLGLGQRMLATDAGEHALMDVRQIALHGTDEASAADGVAGAEEPDA